MMRTTLIAVSTLTIAFWGMSACMGVSDEPSNDELEASLGDDPIIEVDIDADADADAAAAEALERASAPEVEGPFPEAVVDASDPASGLAPGDCPGGWFCLWQHANFRGRMLRFSSARCQNLTNWGFNDETSSWRNRTGRTFYIYWHVNCRGPRLTAPRGSLSAWVGSTWNDQASSVCSGSGCP